MENPDYLQIIAVNHQTLTQRKQNTLVRVVFAVLFIAYVLYLVYLTFFSHFFGRGYFHRGLNLIPFRSISLFLAAKHRPGLLLVNLLGNIAAFVPMGFLPPWISRKSFRPWRLLLLVIGFSMLIEIFQYVFAVGSADVDDVILNFFGGVLGYGIYQLISALARKVK